MRVKIGALGLEVTVVGLRISSKSLAGILGLKVGDLRSEIVSSG